MSHAEKLIYTQADLDAARRAAKAEERERWAPLVGRLADALASRIGTNADEWPDVRAANALLELRA